MWSVGLMPLRGSDKLQRRWYPAAKHYILYITSRTPVSPLSYLQSAVTDISWRTVSYPNRTPVSPLSYLQSAVTHISWRTVSYPNRTPVSPLSYLHALQPAVTDISWRTVSYPISCRWVLDFILASFYGHGFMAVWCKPNRTVPIGLRCNRRAF
jgi:hypothetical protein